MKLKELLTKKYAGLPGWGWLLIAGGGVVAGLYLYNRAKTQKAATSTTATDASTQQPVDLTQAGTTGYGDYSAVGSSAGQSAPGATTINIGVPATNPSNWLATLILTNSGPVPLYDSAGTPGAHELGNQVGTIPGGSQIQATGPEVVGSWLANNQSELWYPIAYNGQAGFINAYYVASANSSIQNNPVVPPVTNPPKTYTVTSADLKLKQPVHDIASRFMVDFTTLYNANKSLFGPDPGHITLHVGEVITIPQKGSA